MPTQPVIDHRGDSAPVAVVDDYPLATTRCTCTHYRSEHDDNANAKCGEGIWIVTAEVPRGDDFRIFEPCDCPGFEADPKANTQ